MHESWCWHLTYTLPLIAYHVIFLYRIQRHKVKSAKYEYLLRFKDRHRRMSASCLLHRSHIAPLPISLLEFLYATHIVCSVETTNCINAVC